MNINKKHSEEKLNVLISKELKKKYKIFCIKKNFSFSKRIRELIENDLKNG